MGLPSHCKSGDEEWVSKKHNEDIGYQAVETLELLELLCDAGGDLDDLEITGLNTKMLEPWDGVESPVMMLHNQTNMSVSWNDIAFQSNLSCASHMQFRLTRP
jgi:hypothetical protein